MILLPTLFIFIAVWIAILSEKHKHRVIALAVFLLAMTLNIAILANVLTLTSACEADLIYGEKCVLQAVPIYNLGD